MSKNVIVGIFGGGQLGMMLCEAAKKLKVRTHIFCPDTNAPAQFHSDFFTTSFILFVSKNRILSTLWGLVKVIARL